jgi:hypothetical protein
MGFKLPHRNNYNEPVIVEDIKFFIDYPTREQEEKIEYLKHRLGIRQDPQGYRDRLKVIYSKIEDAAEPEKEMLKVQIQDLESKIKSDPAYSDEFARNMIDLNKLRRESIKYSVKSWENFLDTEDQEVKCVLIENGSGTEIEDKLFWSIFRDETFTAEVFEAINNELKFIDVDKKK